jgi:tRNA modification GTPase
VIEVPIVLAGYKLLLADTAGLRDTAEEIEAEGVRRARAWAEAADLRLWVVDSSVAELGDIPRELQPGDLCILAKRDLPENEAGWRAAEAAQTRGLSAAPLTARSPNDVAWLRELLAERVVAALTGAEPPAATRLRHRELLSEAADRLRQALAEADRLELAAEDVRLAARALDRITGRIDPEAVLGRIFATFCIGK